MVAAKAVEVMEAAGRVQAVVKQVVQEEAVSAAAKAVEVMEAAGRVQAVVKKVQEEECSSWRREAG